MMPVASVELGMPPRREWEMLQSMTKKASFAEWPPICDFVLTALLMRWTLVRPSLVAG
ncbi:hypothetical protein X738_31735 [Mesorhizobium sp. LNHC209A00]|nr:hypothetical protein X738_31735 [Mesorhizobium sp. LNHC209A00]